MRRFTSENKGNNNQLPPRRKPRKPQRELIMNIAKMTPHLALAGLFLFTCKKDAIQMNFYRIESFVNDTFHYWIDSLDVREQTYIEDDSVL